MTRRRAQRWSSSAAIPRRKPPAERSGGSAGITFPSRPTRRRRPSSRSSPKPAGRPRGSRAARSSSSWNPRPKRSANRSRGPPPPAFVCCSGRLLDLARDGLHAHLLEGRPVEDPPRLELDRGRKPGHFVVDLEVIGGGDVLHRPPGIPDDRLDPALEEPAGPYGDQLAVLVEDIAIAQDAD